MLEAKPSTEGLNGDLGVSEVDNARRLAIRWGRFLRYVHEHETWYVWDGRRWTPDTRGQVMRWAIETLTDGALAEYEWLEEHGPNSRGERARLDKTRPARNGKTRQSDNTFLLEAAERAKSHRQLRAMIALAQAQPGMSVNVADLDTHADLLNVRNGVVDLRDGSLRPHDPDLLITKLVDVDYDPSAECLVFDTWLAESLNGDAEMVDYLQLAAGYSARAGTEDQVMVMLIGPGHTGKSTFLDAMEYVLGDYHQNAATSTILNRREGTHPEDLARLAGARFVTSTETEAERKLTTGLVKAVTAGDQITARFMRAGSFDYKPTYTVWLATNHKPMVDGSDDALMRRLVPVPWNNVVPLEERDRDLPKKLHAEASGILAWIVRGAMRWYQGDQLIYLPDAVRAMWVAYRDENDPIGEFLEQCVLVGLPWSDVDPSRVPNERPGSGLHKRTEDGPLMPASSMYSAYREWAMERGFTPKVSTSFWRAIRQRDPEGWGERAYKSNGTSYYYGVMFTDEGLGYYRSAFDRSERAHGRN